jgi:hypothetical protein
MTKSGERHYGYKDHINSAAKTKRITKYSVSSAAPHDSTELKNITSHIHEKGYRNHPPLRYTTKTYKQDEIKNQS